MVQKLVADCYGLSGSLALPSFVIFPWMRGIIVTRSCPVRGFAIEIPPKAIVGRMAVLGKKAPLAPRAGLL